jgi:hypothetical protein
LDAFQEETAEISHLLQKRVRTTIYRPPKSSTIIFTGNEGSWIRTEGFLPQGTEVNRPMSLDQLRGNIFQFIKADPSMYTSVDNPDIDLKTKFDVLQGVISAMLGEISREE